MKHHGAEGVLECFTLSTQELTDLAIIYHSCVDSLVSAFQTLSRDFLGHVSVPKSVSQIRIEHWLYEVMLSPSIKAPP